MSVWKSCKNCGNILMNGKWLFLLRELFRANPVPSNSTSSLLIILLVQRFPIIIIAIILIYCGQTYCPKYLPWPEYLSQIISWFSLLCITRGFPVSPTSAPQENLVRPLIRWVKSLLTSAWWWEWWWWLLCCHLRLQWWCWWLCCISTFIINDRVIHAIHHIYYITLKVCPRIN